MLRTKNLGVSPMTSLVETVDELICEEMHVAHVKKPAARKNIAAEAGLSPWTLDSLLRGRIKNVEGIAARINAVLIRRLERRIADAEHRLDICRRAARRPDEDRIRAVQAAVEHARRALDAL